MDDRSPPLPPAPPAPGRPRYRVPIGMPTRDEGRRAGAVVSVLIHAAIVGLLIVPFFMPGSVIERMRQGAGGAGPAGGGGGGTRGTGGGTIETLRFVRVQTQAVPTPAAIPPVPAPVPPPKPVVEPPKPVTPPVEKAPEQAAIPALPAATPSAVAGTGGGTGADGSAGAGPGSGGGVGSGIGTGRGSATGPGTGGGNQANYPPTPTAMFIPPMPWPSSVRGFKFTAEFDVDSTGRVLEVKFTETPDRAYNRQLASVLRGYRFRPGTRPDGTPIRMTAQVGFNF